MATTDERWNEAMRADGMNGDSIVQDARPIRAIHVIGHTVAAVGRDGVTSIRPYQENGQMAAVTWFEVWRGGELCKRVNAAHIVEVEYSRPEEASDVPF